MQNRWRISRSIMTRKLGIFTTAEATDEPLGESDEESERFLKQHHNSHDKLSPELKVLFFCHCKI